MERAGQVVQDGGFWTQLTVICSSAATIGTAPAVACASAANGPCSVNVGLTQGRGRGSAAA